jgi:hypothetical protein
MLSNRTKAAVYIRPAQITACLALMAALAVMSVYYVSSRNRVHLAGAKIKALENKIREVEFQDEAVRSRIARLTSHEALRRRQNAGAAAFAGLVPISEQAVVRIQGGADGEKESVASVQ